MDRRTNPRRAVLMLVPALLLGLIASACTTRQGNATGADPATPNRSSVSAGVPGEGAGEAESPFESAAHLVVPVVVNVSIQQSLTTPHGSQTVPVGNGSGVIIRPDGYILTNDHVVAGSSAIVVGMGRTRVRARIIGEDPSTDLAVVKIDRSGLATAQIGDPRGLERGRWVIAVGSPFDLDRTVTAGIISALDRSTIDVSGTVVTPYTNMIQTDAAINPGNSGGALATLDGKVVGITALEESPSGSSAGVGLAIPIDFALDIADQLIRTGHAVHPTIGVRVFDVDPHVAAVLGLSGVTDGALVQDVAPASSAEKAGIQSGDVISSVGGRPVIDAATYFEAMRRLKIGDRTDVVVTRNGKPVTMSVTVAAGSQG